MPLQARAVMPRPLRWPRRARHSYYALGAWGLAAAVKEKGGDVGNGSGEWGEHYGREV
jgi:hypothetical protein